MAYTLVPTELIVDGAVTSAKLDTNIAISGTLGVTGELTLSTHMNMGDNDKIKIGTGGDLEIYHDGSNSYISNSTGNIYLADTNGSVHIQAKLNEESIVCTADGAVSLYHDNAVKLATSSSGIDVTGTVTADGLTVDTSTLVVDATNNRVGIGTTSPARPLDIVSTDQIGIQYTNSTATSTARLYLTAGTSSGILQQYGNTHSTNANEFRIVASVGDITLAPSSTERVRVFTSGDVGIGSTNTGGNKLDVAGNARANAFSLRADGSAPSGDASIFRPAGGTFAIATNSTEKVRVAVNGNVGIGASSALDNKLEVNGGDIRVRGTSTPSIKFNNADQEVVGIRLKSGASGVLSFHTDKMVIDTSGNVGIGISSPTTHLSVANSGFTNTSTIGIPAIRAEGSYGGAIGLLDGKESGWYAQDSGDTLHQYVGRVSGTGASSSIVMTYKSSGNVGIGETSPANLLHVKASDVGLAPIDTALMVLEKSGTNYLSFMGANTNTQGVLFGDADDNDVGQLIYNHNSNHMAFSTAASERMRIDSSGYLFIGQTTRTESVTNGGVYIAGDVNVGSTNYYAQMYIQHDSATNHGIVIDEKATGGSGIAMGFLSGGTVVGSITVSSSATTYNTSSDYRLKENVDYEFNALDRVAQLKPARFNFIADADTTVDGFLAHEVQDIVPEAITGEKDAVDGDGNPEYQGIDQSKLVPLLTKAIQEQQTIIDDLKSRIETLENE